MKRSLRAIGAAVVLAASGLVTFSVQSMSANAAVTLNNSDVTANLWEWNWNSIATACTQQLGPAGYGAVQVAPPAESVSLATSDGGAHPWWEVYQPVSYKLTSRFGTRAQFSSMVTACHNAGVRVYVDAVVNHMAGYLNDLIGLGVDGFRVDAAKHVAKADFASILGQLSSKPYIAQEIFTGALNSELQPAPFVYDGFTFSTSNTGQSPPADPNGFVSDTSCTNGAWQCITQSVGVKGMVGWHNATAAVTTVSDFTATAANIIGFHRGSLGWIGIDGSGSASTATYSTGLADGAYCDVITGGATASGCAGTPVSVSGGVASVTIPANSAVAIHVNARSGGGTSKTAPTTTPTTSPTTSPITVAATFNEYATTAYGTNVYVVGNVAALGSWNTANAVALSATGYPIWSGTVSLPASTAVEYKYIKKDSAGAVTWESGSNRTYTTGTSSAYTISDTWK
ncbi:carbohydrate-binding module family 20 domain-containing protein [Actinoplanes sp. CA-142083]|uniref:carbohydrate-binding module family 20 domain-containing protein n=1 Tax=Actinoplanes sp. CA-142083 TaxID=3239903 RepID=UPI003D8D7D1F